MSWDQLFSGKKKEQEQKTETGPHQFKTEEDYNAFLRVANETVSVGRDTLSQVAGQQESLDRAEAVVDSNGYMIEKSARTLRGMSFWGSIVNYFSDEPIAPRPKTSNWMTPPESQHPNGGAEGGGNSRGEFRTGSFASMTDEAIQAKARGAQPPPPYYPSSRRGSAAESEGGDDSPMRRRTTNESNRDELLRRPGGVDARKEQANRPPLSLAEVKRIQDNYLENLSGTIDEQRAIGSTLHEALREQSHQIERLEDNSEALHDQTRAVIRKASRVSQGAWSERPKLHKFVAFKEVGTGLFLTVVGNDIKLLEPHLVKVCQFAAYTYQTNISGFQSVVSRLWLGQTWTGVLKVLGAHFGKNEEWELDWQRPQTFLMSCSANWGSGGYLMVVGTEGKKELKLGGYSLEDRKKAAVFRIIDCETYRESEYINEVLVPRPLPPPDEGGGGREGRGR